ncbi:hypothetical protein [Muricoccus vinaceus]|uniref:Uncharacterized protein n=1 Tax=Muricoccus vinaceus TaxID=424704 RepID=A0ABV6IRV0_9PROT
MRKPNYDFERSQRDKAKEIKAQLKAQKKLEQKEAAQAGVQPREDGAGDEGADTGRE